MKYWLLTSEYPPFFGGGISTYCKFTAKMLSEKGHAVTVFVNDNAVRDYNVETLESIRVIRFNPSQTNSSAFLGHVTNISYEFAHIVKQFIENEGKPDIIEAQEYLGIVYYLLQFKRLLYDWCKDVPVLVTMHSPSFLYMEYNHVPMYRYPNFWICEMERFCLQAADHVISPSRYMINELDKRFKLTNKNVTVIPNPFEKKKSGEVETDTINEANEIIFYGKLTAQKGAFELLKYFKDLWDSGFLRPLYLVGGQDIVYHPEAIGMGDLIRKKFKHYIQKGLLKLERKIAPAEIDRRLSKAEVVIIPSNNDNLPYVVFEMMALGKIVLVSKQGGQSEVVEEGIDGFVFDHDQPATFSVQLQKILALDWRKRNEIAIKAIEKVKNCYSLEAVYEKKIKVLKNLIERKSDMPARFPFVRPAYENSVSNSADKNNEKLSVVVPYFNLGKYIDETISSIRESDYSDKEIIIVNDGSSDKESIVKLEGYRNSQGIKVVDTVNRGLANARNLGAQSASGKYLAFLDADDIVLPGYYSRAIAVLANYENVHFAGCWTQYFEDSAKCWPTFSPEPPLILFHNLVNSSALVYQRKSFFQAGLNDTSMIFQGLEDYDSVISLVEKGFGGVAIPEALFKYRVRTDSMIRELSRAKKLVLYQQISNKHKQFYATFAADIFNLHNANGPGIALDNPSLDYHLTDKVPFKGLASQKLIKLIKRNRHAKAIAYKLYRILKK